MKITQAFIELMKAGLWEKEARLLPFKDIDFKEMYKLAREQCVVGVVAAGLEHVVDVEVEDDNALKFIGGALRIEQRNKEMNSLIVEILDKMRDAGICSLIVKGQGIAQCYERPMLRACSDVDFLLSEDNYKKAKELLVPMARMVKREDGKHLGMAIGPWMVELHGDLHTKLSKRVDRVIDEAQDDACCGGKVRTWQNGDTEVLLPSADNDVILVFTHFLKHFYKGGFRIRQVCDWCRLLWTYKEEIDSGLLESRIRRMGLMSEWKAFGAYAVEYLGMPVEALPLYSADERWKRKAKRICHYILETGIPEIDRLDDSSRSKVFLVRKAVSFCQRVKDFFNYARFFPMNAVRFFLAIVFNGFREAAKGVG